MRSGKMNVVADQRQLRTLVGVGVVVKAVTVYLQTSILENGCEMWKLTRVTVVGTVTVLV